MSFGVTPTGFNLKRLEDIINDLQDALKAEYGDNIDLTANSVISQITNIQGQRLSTLWELANAIYYSQYPATSENLSLDNVVSLTNIARLSATKSIVTATISGTPATLVEAGFVASVDGNPTARFITLEDATIEGGGTVDVEMEAEETGRVVANSGSLTVIETPVAGVDSITNALDAELGSDVESDADLKIRQKELLQRQGTASLEGIRNKILNIDNVEQSFVLENDDEHYIECIVKNGDQTEIANAIFQSKAAGIETRGNITEQITDSQNIIHDIKFSRPSDIDIYLIVNITPNTDPQEGELYPVDGDTQVENTILAFAENFQIGQDVIINQLYTPINTINGVIGIDIKAGTAPSPTQSNNISVDFDEIAIFDSSRITVNS